MRQKILLAVAAMLLSVSSVLADVTREVTFTVVPKMSCANCEKKIKSNLRFEKGVKSITTSIPKQKVEVTYNPEKTSEEKIVSAFKKIGYKATVVKTDDSEEKK